MGRRPKDPWFTDDGKPILRNWLYKNSPEGDFLYDFRIRGKHFKGSTGEGKEDVARAWVADFHKRMKAVAFGKAEPPAPTLAKLWEAWDERKESSVSASHRRYMKGVVHQHTHEFLKLPADRLTTDAMDDLRSRYLAGEGKGFKKNGAKAEGDQAHVARKHSEGGWNKVVTQLRALVGWAVETGRLKVLPFKAKKLPVSQTSKGVLWPEQVRPFLAAVDTIRKERDKDPFPHAGIAARLMLGLGLRENEALHAEWDRVDWRRQIFIVAESASTRKKVKDRTIREIPIPSWLLTYLSRWHTFQGKPPKGLLMVARNGQAHREGATKKMVQVGARALKIERLTPHGLRRTFATGLWEIGTPLGQIAQMLGHEDPMITFKRYIIERPKEQAEALEKLGKLMDLDGEGPSGADRAENLTSNPQTVPTPGTE